MTYQVETCRPDKYTIVYKTNVVLLTDMLYLYNDSVPTNETNETRQVTTKTVTLRTSNLALSLNLKQVKT